MDKQPETIIHEYLQLAERVGTKYGRKYDKWIPECVAEAYYILTDIVMRKRPLLEAAENQEAYLRITITMRLRDYFAPLAYSEKTGISPRHARSIGELKADPSCDHEMIDWLSSLFPNHRGLTYLMREGFDLEDMRFLDRASIPVVKQMLKMNRMLRRSRAKLRKELEHADRSIPDFPRPEDIGDQTAA